MSLWNYPLKQMQHQNLLSEKITGNHWKRKCSDPHFMSDSTLFSNIKTSDTLCYANKKVESYTRRLHEEKMFFPSIIGVLKTNKHTLLLSIISYPDVSCTPAIVSNPEFMSCSISTDSHQLVLEFSCLPGLQSILEQDQKISV